MQHAQGGRQVDQLVQAVPAASTQALHHLLSGGRRQRDQQHEAGEADRDVRPVHDVFEDVTEGEELIDPDVGREVQRRVKERVQPQHPPQLDQPADSGELTDRRHGKREHQEGQRPPAGAVSDLLDRVGAEAARDRVDAEENEGHERQDEDAYPYADLDPLVSHRSWHPARSTCADPCPRTGAPPARRSR